MWACAPKSNRAEFPRRPVAPGADDHVAFAGGGGLRVAAHAGVAVERPLEHHVEPAAEGMNGTRDALQPGGNIQRLPVFIEVGMADPIVIEPRIAAQLFRHVDERQMPDHLVVGQAFGQSLNGGVRTRALG